MGRAKQIKLVKIPTKVARAFIKKNHYSGTIVSNSIIHFGAFLGSKLHGVMSFGPPLDKRKVLHLVFNSEDKPCKWHEMLELNRMAFDDLLPRNSESRCIAIAIRKIKEYAPQIKWILTFADGGQCGDGTIYRAAGFKLTAISKCSIYANKKGERYQQATISARGSLANKLALKIQYKNKGALGLVEGFIKKKKLKLIDGYSFRYIKILDETCYIAGGSLPYSAIDEVGGRMYKGKPYNKK